MSRWGDFLPTRDCADDPELGVTFSLKGPNMTVPMTFYRKVVEYIVGLQAGRKNFPTVSDPAMFTESMMLMIIWAEDRANGFDLELSPAPEWFPIPGETNEQWWKRKDELLASDPKTWKQPGRDYIPQSFTKRIR